VKNFLLQKKKVKKKMLLVKKIMFKKKKICGKKNKLKKNFGKKTQRPKSLSLGLGLQFVEYLCFGFGFGYFASPVAARHVLNVGGRHTTFAYFRPLAVFSLA